MDGGGDSSFFSGGTANGGGGGATAAAGGGNNNSKLVAVRTFHRSFVQVQGILDRNRALIGEIDRNHESRAPDALARNVGLIRELNANVRRVVGLYADLSASFARTVSSDDGDDDGGSSGTLRSSGQKRVRPC